MECSACAGGCRGAPAAAASAGLHGVYGPPGLHAGVVVGGLCPPAGRLPRLPEERAAPARRQPAGGRRLHLAHAAPRPQHAPARLADHHRRAQVNKNTNLLHQHLNYLIANSENTILK